MTIDAIESQIQNYYRFWAEQAPGVTPREEGRLAALWLAADRYYAQEARG